VLPRQSLWLHTRLPGSSSTWSPPGKNSTIVVSPTINYATRSARRPSCARRPKPWVSNSSHRTTGRASSLGAQQINSLAPIAYRSVVPLKKNHKESKRRERACRRWPRAARYRTRCMDSGDPASGAPHDGVRRVPSAKAFRSGLCYHWCFLGILKMVIPWTTLS
jgi:hypothetical protein